MATPVLRFLSEFSDRKTGTDSWKRRHTISISAHTYGRRTRDILPTDQIMRIKLPSRALPVNSSLILETYSPPGWSEAPVIRRAIDSHDWCVYHASSPKELAGMDTASWIAATRERESIKQTPLFVDHYARYFTSEEGNAILRNSERASAGENKAILVRIKYFDDFVEDRISEFSQIVLIGCGYDMRAFRFQFRQGATLFEIDRKEILNRKEEIARKNNLNAKVRTIPVISEVGEGVTQVFCAQGFDRNVPTLWIAEGLFFYLYTSTAPALVEEVNALSCSDSEMLLEVSGTGLLELPSMEKYFQYLKRVGQALPFRSDYPERLFAGTEWEVSLDYYGSPSASFGLLREFSQDLTNKGPGPHCCRDDGIFTSRLAHTHCRLQTIGDPERPPGVARPGEDPR